MNQSWISSVNCLLNKTTCQAQNLKRLPRFNSYIPLSCEELVNFSAQVYGQCQLNVKSIGQVVNYYLYLSSFLPCNTKTYVDDSFSSVSNYEKNEQNFNIIKRVAGSLEDNVHENDNSKTVAKNENDKNSSRLSEVHLVGIITFVPDILVQGTSDEFWEMIIIDDIANEKSIASAIYSLLCPSMNNITVKLYPRNLIKKYSFIYPGALVNISGRAYQWDYKGNPTSIGLTNIEGPSRPVYNWNNATDSSFTKLEIKNEKIGDNDTNINERKHAIKTIIPNNKSIANNKNANSLCIHFCSGPFPSFEPVKWAVENAFVRDADILVICGPFISVPKDKDLINAVNIDKLTFLERLNNLFDIIDLAVENYNISSQEALKKNYLRAIYIIPSLEDAEAIPVLPQVKFPIDESTNSILHCLSNPCSININNDCIRIKCCTYNSLDRMAEAMTEYGWNKRNKRLNRVVEAIIQSRLMAPITCFPPRYHDLPSLDVLRIMDPLEIRPPHIILSTTSRSQAFACISHGKDTDDCEDDRVGDNDDNYSGDGILFISASQGDHIVNNEKKFSFQVVEININDINKASNEGLGKDKNNLSVLTLDITGEVF